MIALLAAAALACTVTDGDTIRCGSERIRLLGIDAPELPGHCRRGRVCAPGDGYSSKHSLEGFTTGRTLAIHPVTRDRYGRTVATVSNGKYDLSCLQLIAGQAIYKREWDNGLRIFQTCPRYAR